MQIRQFIQTTLDRILLANGIMSHHLRRVKVDTIRSGNKRITVNNDEYVVFSILNNKNKTYGDGVAKTTLTNIDINYYYSYDKNDTRFKMAENRISKIISTFLSDSRFKLKNGQSDLFDLDNNYRGINVEFSFIGVVDNGDNQN